MAVKTDPFKETAETDEYSPPPAPVMALLLEKNEPGSDAMVAKYAAIAPCQKKREDVSYKRQKRFPPKGSESTKIKGYQSYRSRAVRDANKTVLE